VTEEMRKKFKKLLESNDYAHMNNKRKKKKESNENENATHQGLLPGRAKGEDYSYKCLH
jgi:hypothetical protein